MIRVNDFTETAPTKWITEVGVRLEMPEMDESNERAVAMMWENWELKEVRKAR